MPRAIWDSATVTGAGAGGGRPLIPGIEPGGSRVGAPTKPALRIRNVYIDMFEFTTDGSVDWHSLGIYLALSKNENLIPAQILKVSRYGYEVLQEGAPASEYAATLGMQPFGQELAGTLWAPAYVGWYATERGVITAVFNVVLDYEVVDVDWMSWFIMWDWLDNVVHLTEEF